MTRLPAPSPPRPAQGWSAAAVDQLKALWGRPGMSAAVIAERLGVSRNAVLGKAHRLGLSRPRSPGPLAPPRAPRLRPLASARAAPRRPRSVLPALPALPDLAPLVPRLEALPPRGCHWPIGDPRAEGFGFCGRAAPARRYCDAHWRRAHRSG